MTTKEWSYCATIAIPQSGSDWRIYQVMKDFNLSLPPADG